MYYENFQGNLETHQVMSQFAANFCELSELFPFVRNFTTETVNLTQQVAFLYHNSKLLFLKKCKYYTTW